MTSTDFDLRQDKTAKMLVAQAEAHSRHTTCGENGDSCRCLPGQCKLLQLSPHTVDAVEELCSVGR